MNKLLGIRSGIEDSRWSLASSIHLFFMLYGQARILLAFEGDGVLCQLPTDIMY